MDQNPAPEPSEDGPPEPGQRPVCQETTRHIAAFVAGKLEPQDETRMRRHMQACKVCRTSYRDTVETMAGLGRKVRLEREEQKRDRRHHGLRQRAFAATADPGSKRRFGLRLALLPAGVALIMILWQAAGGGRSMVAHWETGEARAAGILLGEDQAELVLTPGDFCETGPGARMTLRTSPDGEPAFELGPETQLQLEDVELGRARLRRGVVSTHGACLVTTSLGVLEVSEGRAVLSLVGRGFELECLEGELSWVGPLGERRLTGGERLQSSSMLVDTR